MSSWYEGYTGYAGYTGFTEYAGYEGYAGYTGYTGSKQYTGYTGPISESIYNNACVKIDEPFKNQAFESLPLQVPERHFLLVILSEI